MSGSGPSLSDATGATGDKVVNNIIPLDREFIATDMTLNEIREKARGMGWPGIHICSEKWLATGILVVERLTRKKAYDE